MSTTTKNVYEAVFDNMKKAADANLKLQQELFHQWSSLWPGLPLPQSTWTDKVKDAQHQWVRTITELARQHRDTFDKQYQATLASLEEALKLTEATTPEEFRQQTEQICRKTLDCMREVSEAQMHEFQEAMKKWSDLVAKSEV